MRTGLAAGVELLQHMAKPDESAQTVPHVPVLLAEVLNALAPLPGARIVDGTFGAGGYSRALLKAGASVIGIDRDPSVLPFADALKAEFPSQFSFVAGVFAELDQLAAAPVDGVVPRYRGSPRCNSTKPIAASPSCAKVRSTCAWLGRGSLPPIW